MSNLPTVAEIRYNVPYCHVKISTLDIDSNDYKIDIRVDMSSSFTPDTFKVEIYNIAEQKSGPIKVNNRLVITLGYKEYLIMPIIIGNIRRVYKRVEGADEITVVEGIDNVIHKLKSKKLNASFNTPVDIKRIVELSAQKGNVKLYKPEDYTGIVLDNFTIESQYIFDVIKYFAEKYNYNACSKGGKLYFTPKPYTPTSSITEIGSSSGATINPISSMSNDNRGYGKGYLIKSAALPNTIPLTRVWLNLPDNSVDKLCFITSVVHIFDSEGYRMECAVVEVNATIGDVRTVPFTASGKSISNLIEEIITKNIDDIRTLDTVSIEQAFEDERLATVKIGIDPESVKNSVTPNIEADSIGYNDVHLTRKPIMSPFAGDGYGMIVPLYYDMRGVIGFDKKDLQNATLLGFVWKRGWEIPEHDEGDWMLHMLNRSKFVMKEDGSAIIEAKNLKITVGNTGLVPDKPTKTDDQDLLIEFDNGVKIQYDYSANKLYLGGSSVGEVHLADGSKKIVLDGDDVNIDAGFDTWLDTHIHLTSLIGPPNTPAVPQSATKIATVSSSATKSYGK